MRRANRLTDMAIDEVSLVDKDANGHARMLIAKADSEEQMTQPNDLTFSEDDLVFDEQGNAYLPLSVAGGESEPQDEDETTYDVHEDEDDEVNDDSAADDTAQQVLAGLSKALGDSDRDQYVAKAMGEITKAQRRADRAEGIAKAERDLRLTREYIAKAAEYTGLPVPPEVLGPILKRCTESLSKQDCEVLAQCLDAAAYAGEGDSFDPYAEIGKSGGGDNDDILTQVNAHANEMFGKAEPGTGFTREHAVSKVFEDNPAAYDEYLAQRRGLGR